VSYALGFCCRTGSAAAVAVSAGAVSAGAVSAGTVPAGAVSAGAVSAGAVSAGVGSAGAVPAGAFAGRWAVDLCADGVPAQLFHAAAGLPAARAERFVRDGVEAVGAVAAARLDAIVAELAGDVRVAVVTGDHPVPDDVPIARILVVHTLMHGAEGQLYRDALLDAAAARGLVAHGVPRGPAQDRLAGDLAGVVAAIGAAAGRPWRREQKLATVAALVAAAADA
jgi:hypothetical protein